MLPRECQTKDWKARRKVICGKTLDFESAVKAAVLATSGVPVTSQVGPSIPPFKRTPSFVDHIRQLNLQLKADLVQTISQLDRQQFTTLHFPFKPVQTLVRSHRETAVTTGDKAAVAKLCQFIVWTCIANHYDKTHSLDFEVMIQQMAKEFAFPELKAAMIEMQTLQFRDQFSRP